MMWLAWRQFRTAALSALGVLAVMAIALAATGHDVARQWSDAGAGRCGTACGQAFTQFTQDFFASANGPLYLVARLLVFAVPAVIGVFWGAPLVARELETGTHRLAWSQSVTRTRWLATKLAITGTGTMLAVGLLSWAVTAWSAHTDEALANRLARSYFGARDLVPVGDALFALALGVTLGIIIRRTVPAMAATLVGYLAAVGAMTVWVRQHLATPVHTVGPLVADPQTTAIILRSDNSVQVISDTAPTGAWVLSNTTLTADGVPFTGPADPHSCGQAAGGLRPCLDWINGLGLSQDLVYQPANHFWPLQWAETGILVALAAALIGLSFRLLHR